MSRKHLVSLAVLLALGGTARASDPVGIYALIDRVLVEPSVGQPQRIQLWGAFALAQGSGVSYAPPARGFMYFQVVPGKEEVCRKEWADLQRLAGKRQVVAFGARYRPRGTVRGAGADPTKDPDPYPLGFGLTRVPPSHPQARLLLETKP